jgi:hypothetical protein
LSITNPGGGGFFIHGASGKSVRSFLAQSGTHSSAGSADQANAPIAPIQQTDSTIHTRNGPRCHFHLSLRPNCPTERPNRSVFMTPAIRLPIFAAVAMAGLSLTAPTQAQQATMSFFVTSVGKGNGADLGGLAGADKHCHELAKAPGSTETKWRAYLSTTEPGGVCR